MILVDLVAEALGLSIIGLGVDLFPPACFMSLFYNTMYDNVVLLYIS